VPSVQEGIQGGLWNTFASGKGTRGGLWNTTYGAGKAPGWSMAQFRRRKDTRGSLWSAFGSGRPQGGLWNTLAEGRNTPGDLLSAFGAGKVPKVACVAPSVQARHPGWSMEHMLLQQGAPKVVCGGLSAQEGTRVTCGGLSVQEGTRGGLWNTFAEGRSTRSGLGNTFAVGRTPEVVCGTPPPSSDRKHWQVRSRNGCLGASAICRPFWSGC
jgi:hypothetical protein